MYVFDFNVVHTKKKAEFSIAHAVPTCQIGLFSVSPSTHTHNSSPSTILAQIYQKVEYYSARRRWKQSYLLSMNASHNSVEQTVLL